jgi:hypothetical protein
MSTTPTTDNSITLPKTAQWLRSIADQIEQGQFRSHVVVELRAVAEIIDIVAERTDHE